ncbi:MAG: SAM-dependent methyltransferase [Chloroflexi bacterium]|nr:MAG: SAM-dependent methyltransferase [Chloroflexota bacterium]
MIVRPFYTDPCPNCGTHSLSVFYEVMGVPVHSVLLMPTRERAVTYRRGAIRLALCGTCGFISNVAFDSSVHEYAVGYEATQSYSPTFNTFHTQLAQQLIDRYQLRNKHLIEIGCGQGEFLILLCELGNNQGVGFDPAYDPTRPRRFDPTQVQFVQDFYSEKYSEVQGDFICCKMTLEHIPNTAEFVRTVRRSIGDRRETIVFFQVPNGEYVMRDVAFWDIYYEHCSYFSVGSLAYLFEQCGFEVLDVATQYGEQYLTIEARPAPTTPAGAGARANRAIAEIKRKVGAFVAAYPTVLRQWESKLQDFRLQGKRVVIWGSGSKGVAFLTTLAGSDVITHAVDVNPYRHGTFMAGTGQEIVGPDALTAICPDIVIVMNPLYCNEIQQTLELMGLHPQLLPLEP